MVRRSRGLPAATRGCNASGARVIPALCTFAFRGPSQRGAPERVAGARIGRRRAPEPSGSRRRRSRRDGRLRCWRCRGWGRRGGRSGKAEQRSNRSGCVTARAGGRGVGSFELTRRAELPVTPIVCGFFEREHGAGRARGFVGQALDDHAARRKARLGNEGLVGRLSVGARANDREVARAQVLRSEGPGEHGPARHGTEPGRGRRRRRRRRRGRGGRRGRSTRTRRQREHAQGQATSPDCPRHEAQGERGTRCEAQARMVTRPRCATLLRCETRVRAPAARGSSRLSSVAQR